MQIGTLVRWWCLRIEGLRENEETGGQWIHQRRGSERLGERVIVYVQFGWRMGAA